MAQILRGLFCKGCKYFVTRTTLSPAIFLIYKCDHPKIGREFGVISDLDKKIPKKCNEKQKM